MQIISLFVILLTVTCIYGLPYVKPNKIFNIPGQFDNFDCCDGNDPYSMKFEQVITHEKSMNDLDSLLYIPFSDMMINDFGIHKYVVIRNIKTLMNYHTDSHLINIVMSSLNQSATEIMRLVVENRVELEAMSENKYISDFLDFWCAYRLLELSEFSANNIDVLKNIIFKSTTF